MSAKNVRIRIATRYLVTLLVTAGAAFAESPIKPVDAPVAPVTLEAPPTVAADRSEKSTGVVPSAPTSPNTAAHWFRKDFVLFPPVAKAPAEKTARAQPATHAVQVPATVENLRRTEKP